MPVHKPAAKLRETKKTSLTVPDLVLLSLLAEQPMHGYQANLELERRQVQDWAGVSRPQVYYSLEKLARLGLIKEAGDHEPALGPERRIFVTTAKGARLWLLRLNAKTGPTSAIIRRFSPGWPFPGRLRPGPSSNSSSVVRNFCNVNSTANWKRCARLKRKWAMDFMKQSG